MIAGSDGFDEVGPGDEGLALGIGDALRDARLGRGDTLDDAQRATRIARRYLQALEEEDFAALPATVFARGFLRSYAQFLGLDATELLARFPGAPRPAPALPAASPPARRARQARPSRKEVYDEEALAPIPSIDTRTPAVRLGPWLVAAFVVLVVLAGVVVVVALGDDESPAPTPASSVPGLASTTESAAEAEALPQPAAVTIEIMPDLTRSTVSDAVVALRRSGLPFVIVEVYDAAAPTGSVLEQTPPPETDVDSRSTVTLLVSRGPAPVPEADAPASQTTAPSGGQAVGQ